jgi:hypothetical protein
LAVDVVAERSSRPGGFGKGEREAGDVSARTGLGPTLHARGKALPAARGADKVAAARSAQRSHAKLEMAARATARAHPAAARTAASRL